ncbi:DUF2975 domain-containing protein [Bacteroides ndongoniae]|uniref:DUF2975 domain-containing protein n=1 Tax=Bacteroides ndongoniae TaxID=1903262 RepID=UPI0023F9A0FB|nr:DUF2975 domain-containing protein [Bacteroides ndongoniae]
MKQIRILAVLALLAFVGDIVKDAVSGFVDGWNEAKGKTELHEQLPQTLAVKADGSLAPDSLFSRVQDEYLPYTPSTLKVEGVVSSKWSLLWGLVFPFSLVAIYGFYCVMRTVWSVTKGEVFTRKNVRRMRVFVYSVIAVGIFSELMQWGMYHDLASAVELNGYAIEPYTLKYPWFTYILLALFTEIFAVGVKLKEEQDLTI